MSLSHSNAFTCKRFNTARMGGYKGYKQVHFSHPPDQDVQYNTQKTITQISSTSYTTTDIIENCPYIHTFIHKASSSHDSYRQGI
jgi:hypothetical protein